MFNRCSCCKNGVEMIDNQLTILDQDEPQCFPCREIKLARAYICNNLCPFCSVKEEATFLTSAAETFLPFQSAAIGSVQVLWHNGLGCLLRNVTHWKIVILVLVSFDFDDLSRLFALPNRKGCPSNIFQVACRDVLLCQFHRCRHENSQGL